MALARSLLRLLVTTAALPLLAACSSSGEPREPVATGESSATAAPRPGESTSQFIERARACKADSDCVHLGDFCGAGCAVTVNHAFGDEVRKRLLDEKVECNIDCPRVNGPACVQGLCTSPEYR